MVAYALNVARFRPVVAFVVAHGTTDLATTHWPPIYGACLFTPLPTRAVTALFVLSSWLHFAEDFGRDASFGLHLLAGGVWSTLGVQRGLEFMMAYLALVHTPAHYIRCWHRRRWRALAIAAFATLVSSFLLHRVDVLVVGNEIQRIVVAHVVTEHFVAPPPSNPPPST